MKSRLVWPALILMLLVAGISGMFLGDPKRENPDRPSRGGWQSLLTKTPFDEIAPRLRGLPATRDGEVTARRLVDAVLEKLEGSLREPILAALGAGDWGVQWAGVLAVPRYRPSDMRLAAALDHALGSEIPQVRRTAAEAVAYLGPAELEQVMPSLQRVASDEVAPVRGAALRTLARRSSGSVEFLSLYQKALSDADADARAAGAYGLAQIELQEKLLPAQVEQLRPLLVKAMQDDVTDVVVYAVMALGRAGSMAAPDVPAILALLDDERALVRGQAATALGSVGEPALPAIEAALYEGRARRLAPLLWALRQMGTVAHPTLRRALVHKSGIVRALAAQKLWEQEQDIERAVDVLISVLQEDDTDALRVAVRTLGRMGTEGARAVPALRAHTEHADEKIRAAVLAALDQLDPKDG